MSGPISDSGSGSVPDAQPGLIMTSSLREAEMTRAANEAKALAAQEEAERRALGSGSAGSIATAASAAPSVGATPASAGSGTPAAGAPASAVPPQLMRDAGGGSQKFNVGSVTMIAPARGASLSDRSMGSVDLTRIAHATTHRSRSTGSDADEDFEERPQTMGSAAGSVRSGYSGSGTPSRGIVFSGSGNRELARRQRSGSQASHGSHTSAESGGHGPPPAYATYAGAPPASAGGSVHTSAGVVVAVLPVSRDQSRATTAKHSAGGLSSVDADGIDTITLGGRGLASADGVAKGPLEIGLDADATNASGASMQGSDRGGDVEERRVKWASQADPARRRCPAALRAAVDLDNNVCRVVTVALLTMLVLEAGAIALFYQEGFWTGLGVTTGVGGVWVATCLGLACTRKATPLGWCTAVGVMAVYGAIAGGSYFPTLLPILVGDHLTNVSVLDVPALSRAGVSVFTFGDAAGGHTGFRWRENADALRDALQRGDDDALLVSSGSGARLAWDEAFAATYDTVAAPDAGCVSTGDVDDPCQLLAQYYLVPIVTQVMPMPAVVEAEEGSDTLASRRWRGGPDGDPVAVWAACLHQGHGGPCKEAFPELCQPPQPATLNWWGALNESASSPGASDVDYSATLQDVDAPALALPTQAGVTSAVWEGTVVFANLTSPYSIARRHAVTVEISGSEVNPADYVNVTIAGVNYGLFYDAVAVGAQGGSGGGDGDGALAAPVRHTVSVGLSDVYSIDFRFEMVRASGTAGDSMLIMPGVATPDAASVEYALPPYAVPIEGHFVKQPIRDAVARAPVSTVDGAPIVCLATNPGLYSDIVSTDTLFFLFFACHIVLLCCLGVGKSFSREQNMGSLRNINGATGPYATKQRRKKKARKPRGDSADGEENGHAVGVGPDDEDDEVDEDDTDGTAAAPLEAVSGSLAVGTFTCMCGVLVLPAVYAIVLTQNSFTAQL